MVFKPDNLIGDEAGFPVAHRILNIVLIFGLIIAVWSGITNYLLGLDPLLVLTCLLSSAVMLGLYYLSRVKRRYTAAVAALLAAVFIITPALWLLNGGIAGSIPYYIILFSSVGAVLLAGRPRIAVVVYFLIVSAILIGLEYHYPAIITGYATATDRYIDILIGLTTTIVANVVIIVVILGYYNQEHERAKTYLEQSRKAQGSLLFLSHHDAITGLYNRTYFEAEVADIERRRERNLGVFVVDIDGLKFVNDTLGHDQGDAVLIRTAKALRSSFRTDDIIARIGGDEYVVIVRGIDAGGMEAMYKRLRDTIRQENQNLGESIIPLHLSIGYANDAGAGKPIRDLLREADQKMYREKLYRQIDTAGSIIQTVKQMLATRDYDTGVHGSRLQNIIASFAVAAGLPTSATADIQLFAEFHDVGKIGIADHILHKSGPLTAEEREQIQRHCEIGYRIAQSSNDLLPIADWILKHHEWWNGGGYPLGLAGAQIPLECRLLAIADAYDAMTSDRPYRKAMTHEAAIDELRRCAGSQFDPGLVNLFIQTIRA